MIKALGIRDAHAPPTSSQAVFPVVGLAVLAYQLFSGTRYDCASKVGYLQATIDFALKHTQVQDEFSRFPVERVQQMNLSNAA
jgi:hypothetical protein